MLFVYPANPHARKHGPSGYTAYATFKPWLRDEFQFRCVYCLERERWDRNGHAAFGVDHVKPQGSPEYEALVCAYDNLVYACNRCNSWKRDVVLLDPCSERLAEHVRMVADGAMVGLTQDGAKLVYVLGLNDQRSRTVRRRFLRVLRLFQDHPDDPDILALYLDCFGYPDDLPDLEPLNPPANSRPDGLNDSYFRQRAEGRLPADYF